jgi:protocatechuate 3,4-dioxygenase, alpha subunit
MSNPVLLGVTPSQTVGPYFTMTLGGHNVLVTAKTSGAHIRVEGRVFDGDGDVVEDALIEIWQANALGRYHHPADQWIGTDLDDGFLGFGQAETDYTTGLYWFETIKPGPVPDPEGEMQAPHLGMIVQARGTLNPYFTRMYFPDEEVANEHDLILRMVPEVRRSTLIAEWVAVDQYRFDIRLQGTGETVFFDF